MCAYVKKKEKKKQRVNVVPSVYLHPSSPHAVSGVLISHVVFGRSG